MDRDKALDLALANIEKQFGKGSLMRLGDNAGQKIAAIPTGALSLDLALGIGGLPRGRVVEIYGPESSGKCVVAGTYVWTDDGLETIEELFARVEQPASCTSRVTDVSSYGVRLVNEEAQLELMAGVTHNNRQPVWRVTLDSGRHVEATANHPLRVLNERGRIVWRTLTELREGDVLVSALFGAETATGGSDLSEDEAVLLGYLVAEGTLGEHSRNAVVFTNAHDPDVFEEYVSLVQNVLGVEPDRVRTYTDKDHHIHDTALRRRLFDDYGLAYTKSADKEVPYPVRTGGPKIQRAFLSALYEGDGWIENGPEVGLTTVSRKLAEQVQLLLYGLGIPATLRTRHHDELDRDYHTLLVGPGAVRRFLEQVGFRSARRAEQVARHLAAAPRTTPASPHELAARPLAYERITAIEDAGTQPTFDVVVPATHSFLANGVLSHNTTVALHAVAEAQRLGGIAAFIDAEHALDPTYAKALGVDVDELLVSQPDNGEQALEITDMLVRSGAIDVVVIDSVAALTPRAEIDGEMGDTHVGLQARLMSQALRKLAGSLSRSNTCAVFINQLREKVGVMFGSPETTSGGRALKFYSSVRLDVRRIETLKDGTDAVGNRVRVKVVKNKCLAAGTQVFDPVTGMTHRIEDVVDQRKAIHVVAAAKDGTLHERPVVSWFDQGDQEVLGLRVAGGTTLWATPDHKVLTERGWRQAGQLRPGDRVARPRRFGEFGDAERVSPDHARLLGYLIGDGYVGGKTPIHFINTEQALIDDAARIAATLGCKARRQGPHAVALSHRPGEANGVIDLCRRAGIHGKLAWEKTIPAWFFESDVSAEVAGNLIFGLLESDGWVSREQTGAVRVGYTTTSEQLAHQFHWLLLRFGIVSTVREYDPTQQRPSLIGGRRVQGKRPTFEVRIAGMDNVTAFAEAIPMWGPRGTALVQAIAESEDKPSRGSQAMYLSTEVIEPVLAHLDQRGLTCREAAGMIGPNAGDPRSGMRQMLGGRRFRRDRLQALADALDDAFLFQILAEEMRYSVIREVLPLRRTRTFDIEVAELHTFVAEDVVVHNCAAPFRQAEFDILYGVGISKEGSLIDVGVEEGIIRKAGAWYTYEGEQLGQGKENARGFLKEHEDVALEIEKKVKDKLGLSPLAAAEEAVENPEE